MGTFSWEKMYRRSIRPVSGGFRLEKGRVSCSDRKLDHLERLCHGDPTEVDPLIMMMTSYDMINLVMIN